VARPRRLTGVSYVGPAAYFVTTCTLSRIRVFDDIEFGREAATLLVAYSARHSFAVSAYCLMPDHAHVLVTGTTPEASLSSLVRIWKQVTGYRWQARQGQRLWQPGYFERVLRPDEPSLTVARYIIENPVRAGLARSAASYPLTGSSVYSVDEIVDAVQIDFGCRWRP